MDVKFLTGLDQVNFHSVLKDTADDSDLLPSGGFFVV
jgi:hypothetical protein